MAVAQPIVSRVTKTVEVEEITSVNLILNKEEAEVLLFLLNRVGGDPFTTPRGITDEIRLALLHAGVDFPDGYVTVEQMGRIHFESEL